jgi:cytoskeleton protein RodZ
VSGSHPDSSDASRTPACEQPDLIPLTAGEQLLLARQARGLTRAETARRLKTTTDRLAALEEDRDDKLAPVYRRGLLRSYALLLDLDADAILAADPGHSEPEPELRPVTFQGPALGRSERWLKAASYLLATLLVGTLAWQVTHEAVRLATGDEEAASLPAVRGTASEQSRVNASIAGLEAVRPLAAPDSDGISGANGRSPAAGAAAWEALSRTAGEDALDAHILQPLGPGEHRLEIRASADSWVEILDRDERHLEQDLLRGGQVRFYQGLPPFRVSLGRSSAVQLFVDGQAIDLEPFTRDDVARLILDPQVTTQEESAGAREQGAGGGFDSGADPS